MCIKKKNEGLYNNKIIFDLMNSRNLINTLQDADHLPVHQTRLWELYVNLLPSPFRNSIDS